MDTRIAEALTQIRALRRLTATTGTITRRAQSLILRTLTDTEMITVASILAGEEASNG